jgi:hypothetical protein
MGKYKDGNYSQIYNGAIAALNKHNDSIPYSTRWLYVHLCYLEHRLTGRKEDFFFRSIRDLSRDTRIGTRQIVRGIKVLSKQNLIQTWQMHWTDKETGKKSEKHVTAFRILDI